MKGFMIKTLLLVTLLFGCVLYGMELAKNSMVEMRGLSNNTDTHSSLLDFDIPGLTSGKKQAPKKPVTKANTTESIKKTEAPKAINTTSQSMQDRIKHLDEIQNFNPYAALGNKVGQGVTGIFQHGVQATASLFEHIVGAVL